MSADYLDKGAIIDASGTYRFRLWREWRLGDNRAIWDMWIDHNGRPVVDGEGHQLGDPLSCVFIMLNPSTADCAQDDPTIRRCVSFARRFGFDRLEVVNLFAFRATSPADLLKVGAEADPVGSENEWHVAKALDNAGLIVCAWGAHGGHLDQDETMMGWIDVHNYRDAPVVCLGQTKDGFPRHPLYLKSDAEPAPYTGRVK